MAEIIQETKTHPTETELADYIGNISSGKEKQRVEDHIASCDECLDSVVSAYESVKTLKKEKASIMKKINIYLILAILAFILSFTIQQYFLQFLTATLLFGIKWIADSKSTKMLVMIYEAWKRGGEKEASRIISSLDYKPKKRI